MLRFRNSLLPLALAVLTGASFSTQAVSSSKLTAHLINNYTAGSSNIVAGRPRTLKVLANFDSFPSGMVQAMRDYKAKEPQGKVVVRVWSPRSYFLTDNASASATNFWTTILQPPLNQLAPADRVLIDYLEGPNEGQTPTLGWPNGTSAEALQASQWFNQFWTNLTPLIVAAGYKPCIGSIAVGNPGGDVNAHLAAFVPALRQAKAAGGAWSYHAYTIQYTTDVSVEWWYSLRYRQFYSYFASAYPDLNTMPMILTEGGVDDNGNPNTSGWQARGSAADYQRWLNWFDQQLQQDAYVLGCTLFQNGDPGGWSSFDLEPIAGWMKDYLGTPTNVPPAPTGVSAAVSGQGVTLSWTSPPLNPTTWTVKRATNSSGPFFTLATGINTGVRATSYTDTSASYRTTYYYVVTAVNAAGEGAGSTPVSAYFNPVVPNAINCGGPAAGAFQSDGYYNAGTAYATTTAISTNGVVNPAPMTVYQSQRYGDLAYTLPYFAPRSSYKVRLHFAEPWWDAAGQRVFNVLLNGAQVLGNFDILQAAGAKFKANVQEFNAISDSNGVITVQLVTVTDNASINGIEVVANSVTGAPAAPTNLTATVGTALVTLTWSAPAGATSFSVQRATSSGGPFSVIASNLTQATYRDPSFTPNTTYYYVVSAANAFGEGPVSAVVSARPTSGLPDVVVTSVSWTPATLFSGSPAVFSATVLNRGSAATPANTILGVGFNVDGAGTVSWYSAYLTLAAGASTTVTANGGPGGNSWAATAGPHTVTANVDDVDRFVESVEDNNSTTVPFNVSVTGYKFNSGGGAVGAFAADGNYGGSANTFSVTNAISTSGVANAAPAAVYQSERWGEVAYVLNNLVPGSNYTVRLHFAEISPSVNNVGERRFHVSLNGVQVLSDFDVLAAAGAKFRAVTREVKKQADGAGVLLVELTHGSANEPKCSGIEVLGSAPVTQRPQITGLGLTNGLATLSWQTSPAGIYQVQYRDDLAAGNWTALGSAVAATGSSLSLTNGVLGLSGRFYRVLLIH